MSKKTGKTDWNEIRRVENEAHNLVVRICQSKNIRLRLKQQGKSGHCEIPEIWTMEKAVPLTPEELDEITANGALHIERGADGGGGDGVIYAVKFTRSGGWTVYEQETKTDEQGTTAKFNQREKL